MKQKHDMKALFIIVNAGYANGVVDIIREVGVKGATIINARGSGTQYGQFMGISVAPEKEMILCILDDALSKKAMAAVKNKAGIGTDTHGVSFTMPVEQVVGINTSIS